MGSNGGRGSPIAGVGPLVVLVVRGRVAVCKWARYAVSEKVKTFFFIFSSFLFSGIDNRELRKA